MPKAIENHPSRAEAHEQKLQNLRQKLIEGEAGGDAGDLDFEAIKRKARERSGGTPRRCVKPSAGTTPTRKT